MSASIAEGLSQIATSQHLGQSLARAEKMARDQGHPTVTLEHFLFTLTDDVDAGSVLAASHVDIDRLRTDISGHLGRITESMAQPAQGPPRPDGELVRILQVAGSAARQSPRKQLDGAIILAAVIGDGKSPSAGLLKAHGLTFEEAIRVLQKSSAPRLPDSKQQSAARPGLPPPVAAPMRQPAPAVHVTAANVPQGVAQTAPPAKSIAQPAIGAEPMPATALASVQPAPELRPQSVTPSRRDIDAAAAQMPQSRPAPQQRPQAPLPSQLPSRPTSDQLTAASTDALLASVRARLKADAQSLPAAPPPRERPPITQPSRSLSDELDASTGAMSPPPVTQPANPPPPPGSQQTEWIERPPQQPQPPAMPGPSAGPPRTGMASLNRPPVPFPSRPMPPPVPLSQPPPPQAFAQRPAVATAPVQQQQPPPAQNRRGPHEANTQPMDASWPQMGAAGPVRAMTPPSAPAYRGDSAGPFNPSELEAPVAHRAPARGRGPAVPLDKQQQQSGFELAAFARSLPSRYKLAQTKTVEIRVPRPAVDAITGATPAVKAFALRLKSGDGRVTVEPEGPELVWLGAAAEPTLDEALIWRWRITPRARGRAKLRVQASLKSIAANGQIVDLAIPDHVAQVRITPNRAAGFARIGGWIVAMIVGGILVRFGEGPILTVVAAARRAIGV